MTKKKRQFYSIYPRFSLDSGVSDGQLKFYPLIQFYDQGRKYHIKLSGYPYPKVIDRMTEFLKEESQVDDPRGVAINAMQLVFGTMQLMREEGNQPFKITVSHKDDT